MLPNILLITTDQQRFDSLACHGSSWMRTPHLDRLAREGVRCERAYCTSPVCTPSRASIFSGLMPSRHGAWNIGCHVPDDVTFLSHRLAKAGYATWQIGKAHWQAGGVPPETSRESLQGAATDTFAGPYYGFEQVELANGHPGYNLRTGQHAAWVRRQGDDADLARWSTLERHGKEFGGNAWDSELPTRLHNSVWTADRAVSILERHDPSRPFLLHLGFQDPHHPHALPRDFADRVDPGAVPPPRVRPGELDSLPPHFAAAQAGRLESAPTRGRHPMAGQYLGNDYRSVPAEDARLARAYYYGMVQLLDSQVGRVLDKLDELGLADNTLVIFTSDHGELLGDHGLWLKGAFHYEAVIRVPLLLRWPGRWPAGRIIAGPVSLCDLAPTVLGACGLSPASNLDGVDWNPHLRGAGAAPRDHAIVEYIDDPDGLRLRTLVESDWKVTAYVDAPWGELFDLRNDPDELHNLWDAPAHRDQRNRMLARLDQLRPYQPRLVPRLAYS